MTRQDNLVRKILSGKNVSCEEAKKVLEFLGYEAKQPNGGSSHITFRKNETQKIVLVMTQNPIKLYIVKQIQEALKNE